MSHLLAIAVGPVQEFIVAARRTRDLWFGSYLLSEISKATAKAVQDHRGELIFPAPADPGDLQPGSGFNVANIVLAALNGTDPRVIVHEAEAAAVACWQRFADQVLEENQEVVREAIWNEQVDDVIEFYAAWVRVTSTDDYAIDRRRVMRLLAGRKACRDFLPAKGHAGVQKSSLDGLRESVLRPQVEWQKHDHQRLRVTEGEQLDVVGLVKRTADRSQPYPSVSRVAGDTWIRGVEAGSLARLRHECEHLGGEVLRPLKVDEGGHPHFAIFPFEGTAVFRSRYRELTEAADIAEKSLKPLSRALGDLVDQYGEPSPYLAVLVADGDRVGQALSKMSSAEDHRKFSQSLAGFATEAKKIIHAHQGILVYAGGDDVLAFAPVDQALPCSRKLHDQFGDTMQAWAAKTGTQLTLSIGVAIGHFMEPMEDLLACGRAAERHAKSPRQEDGAQLERNGLAVHLHKRGGGPIAVRANWTDGLDDHLTHLAEWINAKAISGRVAYDLRQIAELYASWPDNLVKDAIQRDTLSILKSKQPRGEQSRIESVKQFVRDRVRDAASLRRISEELLVARQIAVSLRQASGQRDAQEVLA